MEELSIDPGLLSGFLLSATPDGLDRAERRVLRRCATARVFDEHLYNEVLRCDPELQRIPFEQIVPDSGFGRHRPMVAWRHRGARTG